MRLSEAEVTFHREGGTQLKEFLPAGEGVRWGNRLYFRRNYVPKDIFDADREKAFAKDRAVGHLKPGQGLYGFKTDCGYLVDTGDGHAFCSAYEDPARPEICSEFEEGSRACAKIRNRYGVGQDTEEINLNLLRVVSGEEAIETVVH